jgi:3'-5' exoribonuclease
LVDSFFEDESFRAEFRRAPCTRAGHHAYLGGLLEHTVAVATLVQETCNLHRRLDSDLLMAATLLHDAGKTREFTLGAEIGLSEEGRLVGHLAIGMHMVAERAGRIPELDSGRSLALRHCIAAHHGADALPGRRFGSPEALALYRLNALDASVKGALEHGLPQ